MMQRRELPDGWDSAIPTFEADEEKGLATRKASNKVENAIGEKLPWLIAGSADLTDSTSVRLTFDGMENFEPGASAAARSTSGSANTPPPPPATGCRSASCGRSGRPTSPSPTTAAPGSASRR